jgi:hypothetical protein
VPAPQPPLAEPNQRRAYLAMCILRARRRL